MSDMKQSIRRGINQFAAKAKQISDKATTKSKQLVNRVGGNIKWAGKRIERASR